MSAPYSHNGGGVFGIPTLMGTVPHEDGPPYTPVRNKAARRGNAREGYASVGTTATKMSAGDSVVSTNSATPTFLAGALKPGTSLGESVMAWIKAKELANQNNYDVQVEYLTN